MRDLTAYIIDDERYAIDVLSEYIQRTDGIVLSGTSIDPVTTINALNTGTVPDVIFCDIDMPTLNGLDLAPLLPRGSILVYMTAYRDFAADAFDRSALDFLLKPVTYARFLQTLQKIRSAIDKPSFISQKPADRFFIKAGIRGHLESVDLHDQYYIEAAQNYVILHGIPGKMITYLTLAELEIALKDHDFVQIHRSFLVNLRYVIAVQGGELLLTDGKRLPIGRAHREAFLKRLTML